MIQNIEEVGVFCFFFQSKTFFYGANLQEEVDMNKKKKKSCKKRKRKRKRTNKLLLLSFD